MTFYDHEPSKTEPVGDGRYRYRWNIEEVAADAQEGMPGTDGEEAQPVQQTQWRAEEVIVPRLQSNVITAAVIASVWDASYEQKLVNDYNAARLGMYGDTESEAAKAKIQAYTDFLAGRNALKAQVDADCAALGIL